jgi:hypothetical protein
MFYLNVIRVKVESQIAKEIVIPTITWRDTEKWWVTWEDSLLCWTLSFTEASSMDSNFCQLRREVSNQWVTQKTWLFLTGTVPVFLGLSPGKHPLTVEPHNELYVHVSLLRYCFPDLPQNGLVCLILIWFINKSASNKYLKSFFSSTFY